MVDQFCLKWNNYQVENKILSYFFFWWKKYLQASLTNAFKSLLEKEDFVDVTLSAGGKTLRAHKVVLSACSSYFKQLLRGKWADRTWVKCDNIISHLNNIMNNFSVAREKV